VVKEPLHSASHQRMAQKYVWDAEKGAKTQLRQEVAILLMSDRQKLMKV
jgi:hypothetical protein